MALQLRALNSLQCELRLPDQHALCEKPRSKYLNVYEIHLVFPDV